MQQDIAVIGGNGVVGRALINSIRKCENKDDINIILVDPSIDGYDKFKDNDTIKSCKLIFISVPTPTVDGKHDSSIIDRYLKYFENLRSSDVSRGRKDTFNSIIVINSTTTVNYKELYPKLRIVYNPEFLNEITSYEDFSNPGHILIGGDVTDCFEVENFYKNCTNVNKDTEYFIMTTQEAIDFKYIRNLKLAWDVTFWELTHELTHNSRKIQNIMKSKPLPIHYTVGLDGYRGFGGKCLPKDLEALIEKTKLSKIKSAALKMLEALRDFNKKIV